MDLWWRKWRGCSAHPCPEWSLPFSSLPSSSRLPRAHYLQHDCVMQQHWHWLLNTAAMAINFPHPRISSIFSAEINHFLAQLGNILLLRQFSPGSVLAGAALGGAGVGAGECSAGPWFHLTRYKKRCLEMRCSGTLERTAARLLLMVQSSLK